MHTLEESARREWTKSKKKLAAFTIDNLNNNVTSARSNKMTYHRLAKKYMEITVSPIVTFSNIHSATATTHIHPIRWYSGVPLHLFIHLFTFAVHISASSTHSPTTITTFTCHGRPYKTYNFRNDQYTTKFSSKIISSIQIEMNSRAKLQRS